jgi:hypothetical protein
MRRRVLIAALAGLSGATPSQAAVAAEPLRGNEFALMTTAMFMTCKFKFDLAIIKPEKSKEAHQCMEDLRSSGQNYYIRALPSLSGNQSALSLTKDYNAYWLAHLLDLRPMAGETSRAYGVRMDKITTELRTRRERIALAE